MTDIDLLLYKGNIFLINQDYKVAKIRFDSAIEVIGNYCAKNQTAPSHTSKLFCAYSHRLTARLCIPSKCADALADAASAINILEENGSNIETKLIPGEAAMVHAHSGMLLYKLEWYAEAKDAFLHPVAIFNSIVYCIDQI